MALEEPEVNNPRFSFADLRFAGGEYRKKEVVRARGREDGLRGLLRLRQPADPRNDHGLNKRRE